MGRLRRSGLPGYLLALVMGLAILLPEAGHSLAHRHAAEAGLHHAADHVDRPVGVVVALADEPIAGDHPHVDLLATPAGKPLLAFAVAAQTIVRLMDDLGTERRIRVVVTDDLAPPGREHGPPPPARAPPLI